MAGVSEACRADGAGCDGFIYEPGRDRECGCGCHAEGVVFETEADVKTWHKTAQ
jgi:hypothetical protein